MEKYNKLVRDKIPELLDSENIPYEKRIAEESEYEIELIKKFDEEVKEFLVAGEIEELADVIEVIEAIKKLEVYKSVEEVRINKFNEKGGFENKIILKGEK